MMKKYIKVACLLLLSGSLAGCSQAGANGPNNSGASQPSSGSAATSNAIQYAFTRAHQQPDKLLESVMDSTNQSLDIACYSLTEKGIVNSIVSAKQRGVKVRLITDRDSTHNKSQAAAIHKILAAGIPVKENNHKGLMHLKITIADSKTLTTGSFNYTNAASQYNDEVLMVVHDTSLAKQWDDEFDAMWNDTANYEDVRVR
ncbi:phospholipase D-like domain-containing protein [Aneurinibacillus sp. Ricciae_BoGa-3]|uniref:phospholipase D-like domain-containing protein n=1 Tax=Aneurinibacillus sp. Ricciae_BoGa-3 TaxID=3022697 RepID=UPI0023427EAA|nr:phospholipase D-like domain-containing protein [Aneurinibacillus sp. Ricciae_BoGa-3]WCK54725.1 phospholipase D-like domain-containing protein [Aneurinibacillus sp. Ricciae_BoGa-3]